MTIAQDIPLRKIELELFALLVEVVLFESPHRLVHVVDLSDRPVVQSAIRNYFGL